MSNMIFIRVINLPIPRSDGQLTKTIVISKSQVFETEFGTIAKEVTKMQFDDWRWRLDTAVTQEVIESNSNTVLGAWSLFFVRSLVNF